MAYAARVSYACGMRRVAPAAGLAVLVLTIIGFPPFSTLMTFGETVKNS